jgi:hypothetical protein
MPSIRIAEILYPGTWVNFPDRETSFEIEGMLRCLVDRVEEAAVCLTMFEASHKTAKDALREWKKHDQIRQKISDQIRVKLGEEYFRNLDACGLLTDILFLRRKAELGIFPASYSHKIPFIYDHSFLFALDLFGKFVDALCEYKIIEEAVKGIRDEFNARLPMIRKIRNSAHHLEDRVRWYASEGDKRKRKRMKIHWLGLGNLERNYLCYTVSDGSYQKIAVSHETLDVMVKTLNKILRALPWKGRPHISPG